MRLESYRRRALFSNLGVDIAQLPSTQSIDFVPLERRYVLAQFVLGVVWMIVIAMVVFAAVWLFLPEEWRRGLSILLVLPVFPVLTYLSCRRCGYALREHDIALRKGIFWRKQIIQPLVRLQHIEVARGPVDKYLELAGLRIFSAGTETETFTIPGLNVATAEQLRQRLLDAQSTQG